MFCVLKDDPKGISKRGPRRTTRSSAPGVATQATAPGEATQQPSPSDVTELTQQPKASDAAEPTQQPQASDAAEATQQPQASDAAKATQQSQASDAAEATQQPQASDAAEATQQSQASDAAEATQQPTPSDAAELTQQPQASDAAEATQQPQASDAAEATQQPQASDAAEATQQSQASDAADVSQQPKAAAPKKGGTFGGQKRVPAHIQTQVDTRLAGEKFPDFSARFHDIVKVCLCFANTWLKCQNTAHRLTILHLTHDDYEKGKVTDKAYNRSILRYIGTFSSKQLGSWDRVLSAGVKMTVPHLPCFEPSCDARSDSVSLHTVSSGDETVVSADNNWLDIEMEEEPTEFSPGKGLILEIRKDRAPKDRHVHNWLPYHLISISYKDEHDETRIWTQSWKAFLKLNPEQGMNKDLRKGVEKLNNTIHTKSFLPWRRSLYIAQCHSYLLRKSRRAKRQNLKEELEGARGLSFGRWMSNAVVLSDAGEKIDEWNTRFEWEAAFAASIREFQADTLQKRSGLGSGSKYSVVIRSKRQGPGPCKKKGPSKTKRPAPSKTKRPGPSKTKRPGPSKTRRPGPATKKAKKS
ncbi:Oidioi.mRNA.OKI2018_I69.chr1.g12.t1.cds [Oikopleura dioica]|uniref:Oidioi.mRNA.OKI2018_I69.chr1.g12.t1.cds n=1 Tax=Oikopleura dioica TaxID=34765 RepID=A0ABN7SMR2_OIKDI|nr:Oidioi.mRNA.OKI2018_I69.chr1.g12.t1.cds [Oikopleura dioica]